MELYTFLMEFRGGTYISQFNAGKLQEAVLLWTEHLEIKEIKYLSEKGKAEIKEKIKSKEPIKIRDRKNIWFFCMSIKMGFVAVNVVKTSLD
ncbi:hypothetical protein [Chitinophaga tropicalis]|uniref:Uncharacterized protein n=1 Tax=Chitinophaga tropicalis TaxID=2683588 RepID=A0A7K1U472_9BACT|nr:hypothetical protein [Chitinophaga tropicalis]MVT09140.1 hypothetical protein [Chitinophaga tropicalis]